MDLEEDMIMTSRTLERSILPTADEITSKEQPFYRTSDELEDPATIDTRLGTYLDNQFRLLREDMVYDMREELEIVQGKKKGHRMGLMVQGLKLLDLYCGNSDPPSKVGYPVGMHERFVDLRRCQAQGPKGRVTEPPTFCEARVDGLHPYQ
jgi:hypothetical protein